MKIDTIFSLLAPTPLNVTFEDNENRYLEIYKRTAYASMAIYTLSRFISILLMKDCSPYMPRSNFHVLVDKIGDCASLLILPGFLTSSLEAFRLKYIWNLRQSGN
jgi:hypothetical protein